MAINRKKLRERSDRRGVRMSKLEIDRSPEPGFFHEYDRFIETGTVAADADRLNYRKRLLIDQHREHLEGKRILDIACHDGRFGFAAMKSCGAIHVTGIEARAEPAEHARESFRHYGIPEDRFDFRTGDMFEEIPKLALGSIDTVLLFGFLYHTARQYELAQMLHRLDPKCIIIDSSVLAKYDEPMVMLKWEGTEKDGAVWDESRPKVLSSIPSAAAIVCWFEECGYTVREIDLPEPVPMRARVYVRGQRAALIATR